MKTTEL